MSEGSLDRKTSKPNVRLLALDVIIRTMEKNEFFDKAIHDVLDKNWFLDKRDRSFLTRLSKGTVERCIEMDYIISHFSKLPVEEMKPAVRNILRMSVYQVIYMDSVPDSAACNEAVRLAVLKKLHPLKAFVNGIMRNVVRNRDSVPYPDRKTNYYEHLSIWYSMPVWLVKYLDELYSPDTEKLLQSLYSEDKDVTLRCNLSKAKKSEIIASLKKQEVEVTEGKLFDYAIHISGFDRIDQLEVFKKGYVQVQDESSMLDGQLAAVKENMQVLDMCAAPGGKSIHIADDMKGTGRVLACDITNQKVTLIRENLKRTGIHNVKLKKCDALVYNEELDNQFDIVIADLPCSGFGVMAKKCDIKYKTQEGDIKGLVQIQRNMLTNAVKYVKKGGTLIYSTCTITKEENEDNAEWIKNELGLKPVPINNLLPDILKSETGEKGYVHILQNAYETDGFFAAKFIKN